MSLDILASFLAWATLELLFFGIVMLLLVPRMNRLEPPCEYPIDSKKLTYKILETVDWLSTQGDADTTFESFLSGWFLGARCSELRRGNLVEFLAFSMFAKELSALSEREHNDVTEVVMTTEERLGYKLTPGYNDQVRSIRHTLDPVVPFSHRPLVLYAILWLVRAIVGVALNLAGYRRRRAPCGKFSYWYRRYRHRDNQQQLQQPHGGSVSATASAAPGPIVLFHGVGAGLPFYVLAIWKLCRGRTSVIVESPSIMMSLALLRGHRPPSESQLVDSVEGIMERHGLKKAAFFGHSFGSVAVAWMARLKPDLVSQIVLLDPVCLLLFLPRVARSFLHPDTNGLPLHEKLMLFFVTKEMGISHTLRRHSWWYANILWPENVKCPIVVGLAGEDRIVPCKPLRRYLRAHRSFATSPSSPHGVNMDCVEGLIHCGGGCANGRLNGRGGCDNGQHSVGKKPLVQGPIPSISRLRATEPHGGEGTAAVSGSSSINEKGDSFSIAIGEDVFGDSVGFDDGTDGLVRRVELVYWPDAVHGEALARPSAMEEFVRVAVRQEQAFST